MSQADTKIPAKNGRTVSLTRSHGGPASAKRTLPPPPPSAAVQRSLAAGALGAPLTLAPLEIHTPQPAHVPPRESRQPTWVMLGGGLAMGFLAGAAYVFGAGSHTTQSAPHALSQASHVVEPAPASSMTAPAPVLAQAGVVDAPLDGYIGAGSPVITAQPIASARHKITTRSQRIGVTSKRAPKAGIGLGPVAPPAAADLPEQPSRSDIQHALEEIRPALLACTQGVHGMSYAAVTIANTGKVAHSSVEGNFVGTGAGSCIARALRTASFPAFTGDSFKVRYPFVL